MTDKEILKKAIEKAVENGWDEIEGCKTKILEFEVGENLEVIFTCGIGDKGKYYPSLSLNDIIFSHSFAKALFGIDYWRLGLAILIQKKEPLKYIEEIL